MRCCFIIALTIHPMGAAKSSPTSKVRPRFKTPFPIEDPSMLVMAWYTSSAKMAPSGSTTIPSHLSRALTRRVGRNCRKIGLITVGPVTMRIAPNSRETRPSNPNTIAAAVIRPHATPAVTVHNRKIGRPRSRTSRSLSPSDPSKRTIATERLTPSNSSFLPKISSGVTHCPSAKPITRRNSSAGRRNRHPNHWAPTASTSTSAMYVAAST